MHLTILIVMIKDHGTYAISSHTGEITERNDMLRDMNQPHVYIGPFPLKPSTSQPVPPLQVVTEHRY